MFCIGDLAQMKVKYTCNLTLMILPIFYIDFNQTEVDLGS